MLSLPALMNSSFSLTPRRIINTRAEKRKRRTERVTVRAISSRNTASFIVVSYFFSSSSSPPPPSSSASSSGATGILSSCSHPCTRNHSWLRDAVPMLSLSLCARSSFVLGRVRFFISRRVTLRRTKVAKMAQGVAAGV
jgi:hypothetical protein